MILQKSATASGVDRAVAQENFAPGWPLVRSVRVGGRSEATRRVPSPGSQIESRSFKHTSPARTRSPEPADVEENRSDTSLTLPRLFEKFSRIP
jgi:hypothetical protein